MSKSFTVIAIVVGLAFFLYGIPVTHFMWKIEKQDREARLDSQAQVKDQRVRTHPVLTFTDSMKALSKVDTRLLVPIIFSLAQH